MYLTAVAQVRKWFVEGHTKTLDSLTGDDFLDRPYLEAHIFFPALYREVMDHHLVCGAFLSIKVF